MDDAQKLRRCREREPGVADRDCDGGPRFPQCFLIESDELGSVD